MNKEAAQQEVKNQRDAATRRDFHYLVSRLLPTTFLIDLKISIILVSTNHNLLRLTTISLRPSNALAETAGRFTQALATTPPTTVSTPSLKSTNPPLNQSPHSPGNQG
ncbi:hypothetical protein PGT21_019620 [Puccinia graminis f. sp. tritici]|uniref:Uncharacterized protein n=1 Tax=Puccinia graminis f. sp. tritici TaxID=56615 RepID=A0A5B0LQD3_PUCGR|nr:hypothetical protein PGT21_019620 [Puccinia graminis f. sp. tritici]